MAIGNDVTLKVGFDIDKFQAELAKTNSILNGWAKSLQSTFAGVFAARELFRGLQYGIGVIADFEASMSEVKAITGATGSEFDKLRDSALKLGATTKFTAKEVSELQVSLGRLGFSTQEILSSTDAILKLSAATGENLAKSADVAGSTVRSFNLQASETIKVADIMASSFNKTALGLDNFSEAIKYVAPVAANAGLSLEQTTAMLGVLADNGIRGSMAGTSLRKIISDLGEGAAPMLTKKLREMAGAGLSGADAMDEVGRTAYASLLILSKNTEKVDALGLAFKNANGEVQRMADIMQDNLTGDVTKLEGAFDGIILKGKTGFLREWTQNVTGFLNQLNDAPSVVDALGLTAMVAQAPASIAAFGEYERMLKRITNLRGEHGPFIKEEVDLSKILVSYQLNNEAAIAAANQKLKERRDLIAQIFRNLEIQAKFDADKNKSVSGGGLPILQHLAKGAGNMPDKVGSPFSMGISPEILDQNAKNIDRHAENTERLMEINEQLKLSWENVSIAVSSLAADVIGDMAEALGAGEPVGQAFLKSLAKFGIQFGRQLIQLGAAKIALGIIEKNPAAVGQGLKAIAAGAALTAGSAALAASQSGAGKVGSGDSSYASGGRGSINGNTQNDIKISGELKADGSVLLAVIRNAAQDNKQRKG